MPGMYPPGEYDLAGFAVGAVEKIEIIDGAKIAAGDVLLGLASSGAAFERLFADPQASSVGAGDDRRRSSTAARWATRCLSRRAST